MKFEGEVFKQRNIGIFLLNEFIVCHDAHGYDGLDDHGCHDVVGDDVWVDDDVLVDDDHI